MKSNSLTSNGLKVLLAGLFINLTIGVVYSWSVIKKALVLDQGWSNSEASLPYSVAIVVWALTLLFAGRMQDAIGPKKVVTLGAIFTGLGLFLSGIVNTPFQLVLTYGILTGGGIGFAYASVTPPALKWFHASKKGMVTGIVVSGMGLASLYIAPLTHALIGYVGVSMTFMILGIFTWVVAIPLAQCIKNPPAGYVPDEPRVLKMTKKPRKVLASVEFGWRQMLRTKSFYCLWLMFAFASSAGLIIIGNIASIATYQAKMENGFFLVALLAIFNACGRLAAGYLSDRIGRVETMKLVFVMQGLNMLLFSSYNTLLAISFGTAIAGLGYGALLSLFPSVTADYYGVKNFGGNYGVLYTAWGLAGILGPIVAGMLVDMTGAYQLAYGFAALLLAVSLGLAFITHPVAEKRTLSTKEAVEAA